MSEGKPATASLDLGNFNTKAALTYEDHDVLQLGVVEFLGPWEDPNRPELPNALNEFSGRGGLDMDGKVVVGKPALKLDLNFSIKSVVLYLSVGTSDPRVMRKAPDSSELLAAVRDHLVSEDQLREMVRKHIAFLWRMINKHVTNHGLRVTRIGLSHPSFLSEDEGARHFELFTEYVEKVAREVIGDDYEYYAVSEGQATGVYICERFRADVHGMYKHYIEELFAGMDQSEGVPLVIYDGGSSTLSISLQYMTFDAEGRIKNSWSIETPHLKLGLQGGSDIFNSEIKQWLKKELEPSRQRGHLRDGALAGYLQSVERQKRDINYHDQDVENLELYLEGRKLSHTLDITVPSDVVQHSMHEAYDDILELIRNTNEYILGLGSSFAVLFCGGSLTNPGSRSVITEDMGVIEAEAARRGLTVRHAHLTDKDGHWSAAVSGGTSLAIYSMPDPVPMLMVSAIGLQRQYRRPDGSIVVAESENQAEVLFCGGGNLWPSNQSDLQPGTDIPGEIFFSLVCDLNYVANKPSTEHSYKPIRLSAEDDILTGRCTAHDLGFAVSNAGLPDKKVFTLRSEILHNIAANRQREIAANHLHATEVIAILSCFWVSPKNKKLCRSADRKWRLAIQTDPASKRPMVRRAQELPFSCGRCRQELEGNVRVCQNCPNYALCYLCFLRKDHEPSHKFVGVDLGHHPEIPAFSQPRQVKQTASKSTGGRAPRKDRLLARRAKIANLPPTTGQPEPAASPGTRSSVTSSRRGLRSVRMRRPPAGPQSERRGSEQTGGDTASRAATHREESIREESAREESAKEESARQESAREESARQESARQQSARQETPDTLNSNEAWRADFPKPIRPYRIPAQQIGRQSAWEALVQSWRAQRGRLEAKKGVHYRDITEEELEATFIRLLSRGMISADDEYRTDSRWGLVSVTFSNLLHRLFKLYIQPAYVYAHNGHAIFVMHEPGPTRPAMRVWVFNSNNEAANWAESGFDGLGIRSQVAPSQSPAGGAVGQQPSEHSPDEVDAGGPSDHRASVSRGQTSHTGDGPSSVADDASSYESSIPAGRRSPSQVTEPG